MRFSLVGCACLALLGWHTPSIAGDTPCPAPELLSAGVVHGTVQAALNDHGELVLALDHGQSERCPPDGNAELVFLFAPRNPGDLAAVLASVSAPVAGAIVENDGRRLRLTLPGGRVFRMTVADSGARDAIAGLGMSRVERGIHPKGLAATLAEYRDFRLMEEPPPAPPLRGDS